MSVGFIYPQWLGAKRNLLEALLNRKTDHEIPQIINSWLRSHFFELGLTVEVPTMEAYKEPAEFERHMRHMAAGKLADEILAKDLYMRELVTNHPPTRNYIQVPERVYTYTILVGGVPLLTGPGTREAKVMAIEKTKERTPAHDE